LLILAIDQGTSSTKACVFEAPGALLGTASVRVGRSADASGAVHQDPEELVASCRAAAGQALRASGVGAGEIAGVALANQGESYLLFDAQGRPRTPVISWQDVTGAPSVERLAAGPHATAVTARTGLPLHAMFPGAKLGDHHRALGVAGLRFATLDTWLIHELDPGRPFVTDRATASRTMLVALDGEDWDAELLEWLDVPRELLATIVACDEPQAEIDLGDAVVPLWASGYDMGLALLGHGCIAAGEAKATFGTCLGVMSAAGASPTAADGLLSVVAYELGSERAYALDGEIAAAGALVSWAIGCGLAGSLDELGEAAGSVPDAGGVVLVPAIQGLGAPHWRADVRASFVGMTEATGRAELARAVVDAIAWSLADVLEALRAGGVAIQELRVDGGLTASDVLMQRCSDICGVPLIPSRQRDATAFGAAALALLAHGTVSPEDVRRAALGQERFEPMRPATDEERARWADALERSLR
jgi:glycerol kinase